MKAKYIGKHYFKGRKYLEYEYRGIKYDVCDDWNAEDIRWQHQSEQDQIDRLYDLSEKKKKSSYVGEPAQVGFDRFYEYFM